MYSSPAARELIIYLHPCKCIEFSFFRTIIIIQIKIQSVISWKTVWNSVLFTALFVVFFISYQVKNPFQDLSKPGSFGLPENTVNFYIPGQAGKLGAWWVYEQFYISVLD